MASAEIVATASDPGSMAVALLTLTALEIVLGVDNVIFIAILVGKLPPEQRAKARNIGLGLAMFIRIGLLFAISWIMSLKGTLIKFTVPVANKVVDLSGKDFILLAGGLFLMAKATREIHEKMEAHGHSQEKVAKVAASASFGAIIAQILAIDIVFSLDSVITAVGMAQHLWIMVVSVVIAVGIMMIFAGKISTFIEHHPTMKILALSFLILIGFMLTAEAFDHHVPKGYIYFAMAFALGVEFINTKIYRKV